MIDFIYQLIRDFEQEHEIQPNLLYLNRDHAKHLLASFDDNLTVGQIMNILDLDIIIGSEITHPSVVWTQTAERKAS